MAILPILPRSQFSRRADEWDDGDNWPGSNWYWSDEARNIKYGVLFGILTLAFLVIMGMWLHADRRMKSGNAPLPYHRWLVARHRRAQWEPQLRQPEQQFSFYQHQHQHQQRQENDYTMHPVPPPAYNPNYAQPPVYTGGPPIGASKIDPSQHPANQMQSQNPYYNSSAGEGSSNGGPTYPPPVGAPVYHGPHTQ